jgi:hypothetical protein
MAEKRSVHVYNDPERDLRSPREAVGGVEAEPAAPIDTPRSSPDVAPERPLGSPYDAENAPRREAPPARPGWLWPVLLIALIVLLFLILF